MVDQAKRGGQKQGTAADANSQQHRGVRPDSTSQDKPQRKKRESKQKRP